MTTFTSFTSVDMPADAPASYVYNSLGGVDTAGLAVGTYSDMDQDSLGYTAINGVSQDFNPPGSSNTESVGITDTGEIFGTYIDDYNRQHGFIYTNGTFTTIDAVLETDGTLIDGVNDAGVIWGTYVTDLIGLQPYTIEFIHRQQRHLHQRQRSRRNRYVHFQRHHFGRDCRHLHRCER